MSTEANADCHAGLLGRLVSNATAPPTRRIKALVSFRPVVRRRSFFNWPNEEFQIVIGLRQQRLIMKCKKLWQKGARQFFDMGDDFIEHRISVTRKSGDIVS